MSVGQEVRGPWWMRQTAMTAGGRLDLMSKTWWPRAASLKTGESFAIADHPDAGPMMVRRERVTNRTRACDAIVWVIDDDRDGSLSQGGDQHDDCYVVDYDADGTVDRMLDFMDNNGDGKADEMDIRAFRGGELRYVWFGWDLDGDGHMWDLKGYEYSGNFFASDPYGDNMIYMNKFDPHKGEFVPISECPFAFFDTDADDYSEIAVRVSASPMAFDPAKDPDYANDMARYGGPWEDVMLDMGAMNVRYSFDIDNLSGADTPLHYDVGFNMVGAKRYDAPGDRHFNAKRRPPQTTRVIPHDRLRAFCDTYPAQQTGFTWHEQHDDTISIGNPPHKDDDFRWEGVFWTWERRFMANTGGPGQKWNVRREWSNRPSNRRELYYSGIDRRIHLFGASEGWIELGHFAGLPELGEIRMFDSDGDGYFDRWEYHVPGQERPARVTAVRDAKVRRLAWDYEALSRFYTDTLLPEAMSENRRLIDMLAPFASHSPDNTTDALRQACTTGPDSYRRYTQDILRERLYQQATQRLSTAARNVLAKAGMDDLRKLKKGQQLSGANSATAWQLLRRLDEIEVAYGQGDYARTCELLKDLRTLKEMIAP